MCFAICFYRYQLKVFEVAKKRNTIAVLETGAGKTMIAVMLINDIAQAIKSNGDKKNIIFLAPTVHLVHQACYLISNYFIVFLFLCSDNWICNVGMWLLI